jgi:hypothetical protein
MRLLPGSSDPEYLVHENPKVHNFSSPSEDERLLLSQHPAVACLSFQPLGWQQPVCLKEPVHTATDLKAAPSDRFLPVQSISIPANTSQKY